MGQEARDFMTAAALLAIPGARKIIKVDQTLRLTEEYEIISIQTPDDRPFHWVGDSVRSTEGKALTSSSTKQQAGFVRELGRVKRRIDDEHLDVDDEKAPRPKKTKLCDQAPSSITQKHVRPNPERRPQEKRRLVSTEPEEEEGRKQKRARFEEASM